MFETQYKPAKLFPNNTNVVNADSFNDAVGNVNAIYNSKYNNNILKDSQLVIGKGLFLKGLVKSAHHVLVVGEAQVDMEDVSYLHISLEGLLTGSVETLNADIQGTFKGRLKVSGLLTIRKGALIDGEIIYQDIEVERGSNIMGNMVRI